MLITRWTWTTLVPEDLLNPTPVDNQMRVDLARLDDLVDRDDFVRAQQQQCEEGALLVAAEAEPAAFIQHLQWSKYAEIDLAAPSVDSNVAPRPGAE